MGTYETASNNTSLEGNGGNLAGGTQTTVEATPSDTQVQTEIIPTTSETTVQAGGQETTVGLNQPSEGSGTSETSGTTISAPTTDTDSVTNNTSLEGNGGNLAGGTQASKAIPNRSRIDSSQKGGRKRIRFFNEREDNAGEDKPNLLKIKTSETSE